MQKKSRASVISDAIAVAVVSFGNDPIPCTLKKGATVADALAEAGIEKGTAQLFVSGEEADSEDVLEEGDVLSLVTSKQAGI